MVGVYIICPQHNFEGVARYGECPGCKKETERYMEEHPIKDLADKLNILDEEIRKKLKKREERDKKRNEIGLLRHDRYSPGELEYDEKKKEILDKETRE